MGSERASSSSGSSHESRNSGCCCALVAIVAAAAAAYISSKKPKSCLDLENFKEFKLVKRAQLGHNVANCKGRNSQGEEVIKPYSPTTLDSDVGFFELVIKMYPQGCHTILERRMLGRFKYQPGQVRAFGMLAGGSGITPMFQVARAMLENLKDTTKVHLIYANVSFEDILLKVIL
ncbi:hypothetical protein F0562_016569 [Nyssa sinensis]|uniref:Flavoprotein pyridine nucleotide cytochrome reductase-like FAD-binding domain-containing protein n=1 Tax=Nyssa sinensis TaxID=561372 RepID=A0A5J4ZEU4_9ASTE|nr:hypothetical protein F0562_016569 [Nyssa sinensis]